MTIFFDLDGVLVDFVRGALAAHRSGSLPMSEVRWDFDKQIGVPPDRFWAAFGYEFWRYLGQLPDGMNLLSHAEWKWNPKNIYLLSSPCKTRGCADGKQAWVDDNIPFYSRRLFLGSSKEAFASRDRVLLDDRDENIEAWEAAGGTGLLIPRPWNRLGRQCGTDGSFPVARVLERLEERVAVASAPPPV